MQDPNSFEDQVVQDQVVQDHVSGDTSGDDEPVTVIVYADQRLFGEAFAEALRRAGAQAVATSSYAEAVRAVERAAPDLVVVDVHPRSAAAFTLVQWVRRRPGVRIACLDSDDPAVRHSCLEIGADLAMSKRQPLQDIVERLLGHPAGGQPPASRARPRRSARVRRPPREAPLAARFLTRRERDVLRLLVAAQSTKDIARRLGITVPTARGYIQSAFTKLGVHSRVEAVTYAVVHSVVEFDGTDDLAAPG